jgi:hypothetical protein
MKVTRIVIAALAMIAIVVAVLLAITFTMLSNDVPAANARLNNAGYLQGSKLFLLSANATYGAHNGQTCFIVFATVRNDYTVQQPPPMDNYGSNSTGTAFFGLTAKLYNKNAQITATDVTMPGAPPLGVPQIGLDSGETYTMEIDMATSNRNIDNYSVDLVAIAGYPIP